jgi:hypothetical protein
MSTRPPSSKAAWHVRSSDSELPGQRRIVVGDLTGFAPQLTTMHCGLQRGLQRSPFRRQPARHTSAEERTTNGERVCRARQTGDGGKHRSGVLVRYHQTHKTITV